MKVTLFGILINMIKVNNIEYSLLLAQCCSNMNDKPSQSILKFNFKFNFITFKSCTKTQIITELNL